MIHLHGLSRLEILELRETQIGDAGLRPLLDLPSLRVLYLTETRVGDLGMACLSRLTKSRRASPGPHIRRRRRSGAPGRADQIEGAEAQFNPCYRQGLGYLAALEKLEFLDLSNTAVTDAGLTHLAGLKELRLVILEKTNVTRAGALALRAGRSGG